ncbi:HNH endonuclease signature motif containing protein [Mycetocola zhujimingii]|uniref:HNH endonuclease signature motif containing protein n=1 Tax=Mycetocola zhujimingii TaxID=2079792 RepID=UPI001304DBB7|nr:HNH endonuclease signature motif containing protein [Mycetocola zhujimingii]
MEKLEACQAAWKAEFIDRARTLAVAAEEGVLVTARSRSVVERQDLALRSFIAELACTLRVAERSATALVDESRALLHRLPVTLAALREGEISYRHAQVLVDQTDTLTDDAAAELEEKAVPFAKTMPVARFRQKTRMLRERLQPESAVARCRKSVTDRRVELIPAPDGMAWLNLFTTAPAAETIFDTIRAQSMKLQSPVEPRTLSQLDADVVFAAMMEAFTGEFSLPDPTGTRVFGTGLGIRNPYADPDPAPATAPPPGEEEGSAVTAGPGRDPATAFRKIVPTVMVTVPVLTLLGKSVEPGNLDGYGPIDADTARQLASQAPEFSRILTHPETGVALSLGHTKYTPSKAMRRFLRYRDGYCRFPGCTRKAVSSDIDHTQPFDSGGNTDFDNLASLCPKHHKLKHETNWLVEQLGDGILRWTSPHGREYLTHPENPVRNPSRDPIPRPIPPAKAAPPKPAPPKPAAGTEPDDAIEAHTTEEATTQAQEEDDRLNNVYTRLLDAQRAKRERERSERGKSSEAHESDAQRGGEPRDDDGLPF